MPAKLQALLTSRKFWALIIALIAALSGYLTGSLAAPAAIQAAVAALMAYMIGTGLESPPAAITPPEKTVRTIHYDKL